MDCDVLGAVFGLFLYFSDSDSGNDDDDKKKLNWRDLDSDDERRIDAEIAEQFAKPPAPKWDAESILSTRTNHENHPKELKVNVRTAQKMEPMFEDLTSITEDIKSEQDTLDS